MFFTTNPTWTVLERTQDYEVRSEQQTTGLLMRPHRCHFFSVSVLELRSSTSSKLGCVARGSVSCLVPKFHSSTSAQWTARDWFALTLTNEAKTVIRIASLPFSIVKKFNNDPSAKTETMRTALKTPTTEQCKYVPIKNDRLLLSYWPVLKSSFYVCVCVISNESSDPLSLETWYEYHATWG